MSTSFSEAGQHALRRLLAYSPEIDALVRCNTETARKRALKLSLIGPDGKPLDRCTIHYKLKRHEFRFGANAFMLNQFTSDQAWKNEIYAEKFTHLFNQAVVPFYWDSYEPERGVFRQEKGSPYVYRRPPADEVVEFCEAHNLYAKGHPMVWHTLLPKWLPRNQFRLLDEYERHIAGIAERYADKIHWFDVYNEGLQLDSLFTDIFKEAGNVPEHHIEKLFQLAGKYFPASTELIYNEGPWMSWNNYHNSYTPLYLHVRRLLDLGLPVRGLGLQYHIAFYDKIERLLEWSDLMIDPQHIYAHMDLYGSLGIPLNVSEITIPAEDLLGDGFAFQALVAEKMYRLWFSHPAMSAITWWNLVDKTAFQCANAINNDQGENRYLGGLLNNDMTEKPAYKVLDQLINHEWQTDATLEYEREGKNKLYGFCGDYEAEITTDNAKFTIPITISKYACPWQEIKLS
jgi:endo-1,4-beta-xylanase